MVAILIGKLKLSTNERITRKHNWSNKNSSKVFKWNWSIKNKDILMCLDVIARQHGGKVVDNN